MMSEFIEKFGLEAFAGPTWLYFGSRSATEFFFLARKCGCKCGLIV